MKTRIELLEGASVVSYDNENVYICGEYYGKTITPFPIKFLDNLLQIIINNSSEEILCLKKSFYEDCSNYFPIKVELNNEYMIEGILNNSNIIFTYKGEENNFPICWLNKELQNILENEHNKSRT